MPKTLTATDILEKRVSELEQELAELKAEFRKPRERNAWLSTLGRFKDDPIFDEAMRLGRAYRRRQPKC
jgi:hypothetical protein